MQSRRRQRREVCARHSEFGLHKILRRAVRRCKRSELDLLVLSHLFLLLHQRLLLQVYLLLQEASRLAMHIEAVGRWWDMPAGETVLWLILVRLLRLLVEML